MSEVNFEERNRKVAGSNQSVICLHLRDNKMRSLPNSEDAACCGLAGNGDVFMAEMQSINQSINQSII